MDQENTYTFKELERYLKEYVNHHTKLCMEDKDFMSEMEWTEEDVRINSIENLTDTVKIVFGDVLYN
jgi:hypothetical protein